MAWTDAVIAGGENAAETRLSGQIETFAGATWRAAPMLDPRHGLEAALFENGLWLCGGGSAPGLRPTAICTSVGAD